jgi:chitinase
LQVFAIFEYMRTNDFATRFNAVRTQVRTQLGYIEQAFNVPNLQNWWDVFTNDYFSQIEGWALSWANQAIAAAAAPYVNARRNGRNPQTYAQVINTLQQWQDLLDDDNPLRFPPYTGSIPMPRPPPGGSP